MTMVTRLAWEHTVKSFLPKYWINSQWGGLARSCDRLDTLYLHYHNAYGYQTFQGNAITWHEPLITFTTWSHVTVWKIYSSFFIRFMATKLEMEVQLQMLKLSPNSYLVVIFWNEIKTTKKVSTTVQSEELYFNVFNLLKVTGSHSRYKDCVASVISMPLFLTLNSVIIDLL